MSAETSRYGRKLQMIVGESTGMIPDQRIIERLARMLAKTPEGDVPEAVVDFIAQHDLDDRLLEVIGGDSVAGVELEGSE